MDSNKIIRWCLEYQRSGEENEEPINAIDTTRALSFLLVWSIWEQKLFEGYCTMKELKKIAKDYNINYSHYDIESQVESFHKRYQDDEKWINLVNNKEAEFYHKIVRKDFSSLTNSEKLSLALFVVFRYRNNIFHGNKASFNWSRFDKPIQMCYEIMINMLDFFKQIDDKPEQSANALSLTGEEL